MRAGPEGADKIHTPSSTEGAFGENRGDWRGFAHAMVDAGADLVLGSGPHVIRGIERYRTRLIAYPLGNFGCWNIFVMSGTLGLSGLLTVKNDSGGHTHDGHWLSLRSADPGVPIVDPSAASAG
jgi:Bacterial capsule synthesis protein PGA_cap